MDAKQIYTLMEANNDESHKFSRIPATERLHESEVLCGLLKLASLMKKPRTFEMSAEHDVVYLADAKQLQNVTEADLVYLLRCGLNWDSSVDCFFKFT